MGSVPVEVVGGVVVVVTTGPEVCKAWAVPSSESAPVGGGILEMVFYSWSSTHGRVSAVLPVSVDEGELSVLLS